MTRVTGRGLKRGPRGNRFTVRRAADAEARDPLFRDLDFAIALEFFRHPHMALRGRREYDVARVERPDAPKLTWAERRRLYLNETGRADLAQKEGL